MISSAVCSIVSARSYSERRARVVRPVQMTVAPTSSAAAIPRPAPRVAPATRATRARSISGSGDQVMAKVMIPGIEPPPPAPSARAIIRANQKRALPIAPRGSRRGGSRVYTAVVNGPSGGTRAQSHVAEAPGIWQGGPAATASTHSGRLTTRRRRSVLTVTETLSPGLRESPKAATGGHVKSGH